ncbi:hypothetical protein P9112_012221 [Eukaryota sp. TZLM1-RC]
MNSTPSSPHKSVSPQASPKRSRSNSMKGSIYAPSFINKAKYKTEICRQYLEKGCCSYGSKCQFAHSLSELQTSPTASRYKVEICRQFVATGLCQYGSRCRFLHPRASITPADDEKVLLDLVDTLAVSRRSMSTSEHVSVGSGYSDPPGRQRSYSCSATMSSTQRLPIFRKLTDN